MFSASCMVLASVQEARSRSVGAIRALGRRNIGPVSSPRDEAPLTIAMGLINKPRLLFWTANIRTGCAEQPHHP